MPEGKVQEPAPRRQVVSFTFFKVMPEWRRLAQEEREEHRRELADVISRWNIPDQMKVLTYSTVGIRPECDFMLWRICYSLECLQGMQQDVYSTRIAGYLQTPYSYLAMTKRSQYLIGHTHEGQHDSRGVIKPGGFKYAFIYPFIKTRPWYTLPYEERQRMMNEHIRVGHEYPRVRLNTTYSFGLDDQEFVVAFESDHPEDFLDLVMQLRESEASSYTQRDVPVFTCVQCSVEEMLERLG